LRLFAAKGGTAVKYLIISNDPAMLYRYRAEVIKELLKEDNTVVICVPEGDIEPFADMGCEILKVDVDRRGINPIKDLRLYKNYKRIIAQVKPDTVLTYSIKPNIYGGYASRRIGVPYFAHVQGLGSAFQRRIIKNIVSFMYKSALKDARKVFFENSGNRDVFVNKKIIRPDQAIIVRGGAGVPLDAFPFTEMEDDGTVNFLFVGRIMKEKGIDELFSAAKRMKDKLGDRVSFTVAGKYEDEYKDTVNELTDAGVIDYVGFVKDVLPLYKKCHAVVLPSYHEGLANVLIEGASVGRPLITTDIHGCKETVKDGESGILVPVSDAESLCFAMTSYFNMSIEQKREMGLNGHRFVSESFDRRDVVSFTVASLKEGLQ
jgi:galacturonosyltransferase